MHNADMKKTAAVTIRLPASLKRSLEARAQAEHRSLSAQLVFDLEQLAVRPAPGEKGRVLGLFAGTAVPSDEDIAEARRLLWGKLRRHA